ncbi:TPA: hypothetical protein DCZ32_04435, partial [Candidatus Uhrbacteria bacterium]|nr:hypothetical protein [Candidatus Uhrbacteria bacterium]
NECVGPDNLYDGRGKHKGLPLPNIIQWFKTMTTNEYIRNVKLSNWEPFNGKLWQRSYHDHIIRDKFELERIREYIRTNPKWWNKDRNDPNKH